MARSPAQAPLLRVLVVLPAWDAVPANVEFIDRGDPRALCARTRLLLMPSACESYGRAGAEAMLSGIPVLAAPAPGMREAFGGAASYLERDDVAGWAREIRRLDDPAAYATAPRYRRRPTSAAGGEHPSSRRTPPADAPTGSRSGTCRRSRRSPHDDPAGGHPASASGPGATARSALIAHQPTAHPDQRPTDPNETA
ncbi:hypothetical protein GCM10010249_28570 [Streptomyces roseolilacinus]|uniref:Glycosyl transferase family 1 domain-containing protein n=1 Tax=Streptomyces roseolilacinus TaxID=66904 RepID=A0A918EJT0_9ACTN|nr:hypothetical protein GCM10010249_28570 [Streptomyces roseolilacinus]